MTDFYHCPYCRQRQIEYHRMLDGKSFEPKFFTTIACPECDTYWGYSVSDAAYQREVKRVDEERRILWLK